MQLFVLRVSASAQIMRHAVAALDEASLCKLLHTDVTERLRAFETPDAFAEQGISLCYHIDGRGGERGLDSNFCGTCLYHTGCPVYGDLIFSAVQNGAPRGFSQSECDALAQWLSQQFPFLSPPDRAGECSDDADFQ